ncbi:MAG: HAD family hydrolase [Leptolyngbyaceae cyanobacterium SM2_3_12]|nr:HAD family hydrolase [Leptolyngbyaceae cyanobacterium SM2_3_12]
MPQVLCQQHSIAQVEAIIFDKDGTLADSRGFLTRLAKLRAEGIAEAVVPVLGDRKLEAQLLEIFGLTPAGLNPDGLMAAETRQANQQATVDCLVKAGYPAELSPGLVAQVFTQVDTQLAHKAEYTPPLCGYRSTATTAGAKPD